MSSKAHAVCIPFPAQGHINPMLKLAKILHSNGFHITFVNSEYNHQRLLKSQGGDTLNDHTSFHFATIPDGLPLPENLDVTQDIPSLCKSTNETCLGPFKNLISKVIASYLPVTCIVADFVMNFTLDAGEELGILQFLLWTGGAASLVCYNEYPNLIDKGLMPLKDSTHFANGYLDTMVDCIPNMGGIRLRDIPPFVRIMNPGDEFMVEFASYGIKKAKRASGIIFNTFQELEHDILNTLSSVFPPCYTIGPLHLICDKISRTTLASIESHLWKKDPMCLKWLDTKAPNSVVYVNFGSITVMTPQQLVEFCWGLAKSNQTFLWIIRPDLVIGDSAILPQEFVEETSGRGLLVGWCQQEQVLKHPSIGGFLTHSGWNSTIESISNGVPMICWPFFADQQPNCWMSCTKWGVAMEIDNNVTRDAVQKQVTELMIEDKGKYMRKNTMDWKQKVDEACSFPSGSSMINLENLLHQLQYHPN